MSKKSNQTNHANGEKAAGTAKLRMTVRESKVKIPLSGGASGENADTGNRNKRS